MNQLLIEKFVAGKLSSPEADAFEEYCVENPDFARRVELEQRLKAGLAQVARGSTSEFVRSGRSDHWKVALAASAVVFVFAAAWLWQREAGTQPHILAAAVAGEVERGGPSLRLALVRGAENVTLLPRGTVRVEIVGLFDPGSQYSVVLDRLRPGEDIETVAALYGQHPKSPVALDIRLDGEQLASGSYSLRIIKQASREEPLDFGFVKL